MYPLHHTNVIPSFQEMFSALSSVLLSNYTMYSTSKYSFQTGLKQILVDPQRHSLP